MIQCGSCGRRYHTYVVSPIHCLCSERIEFAKPSVATHTASAITGRGKVGTELAKIIPRIFRQNDKCECKEYANRMDSWGIDGCIARRQEIIQTLVRRANRRWFLRLFPDATKEAKATEWLDQAIANAQLALQPKTRTIKGKDDWYVAITTAPRKDCTLLSCIESIRQAGWEPTVFAEPGSTITDAATVWNDARKGCWHNWLASAKYALTQSDAKIILTVQDDVAFHPDSRDFCESILWPAKHAGFVSLYTPKHYSFSKTAMKPVGVNRIKTSSLWGACALVWRREVLQQVVNHPIAQQWLGVRPRSGNPAVLQRRRDNPHMIANSDTAIGRILNKLGRTMWFVDPSPCSHIAVHSTIGHGGNGGRRNCYRCADHSRPLKEQVLPHG